MQLILSSPNNPGPASFPTKQNINNGNISNVPKAMPAKFYPSAGSNMFSIARHLYTNNSTDKHVKRWQPISSGERTYLKSNREVGLSSMQSPETLNELSFRSKDTTSRNDAIIRCRAGGCVAPKKKGANRDFKCGGRSIITSHGNRQVKA